MSHDDGGEDLKCSFCEKPKAQVKKLIAGPAVYICDECVALCDEILEEDGYIEPRLKGDPKAELTTIANEIFALVTRLYQQNPATAAADPVLCRRLRRCQWLLSPWLESLNHSATGLEVLQRETNDEID